MTTHERTGGLYGRDFHAWAEQQAALLRRRADGALVNDAALDWSNIAEEIATLGRSEESSLSTMIGTIIEHLMKLQASPATDPRRGWIETVGRSRDDIEKHLDRNPGLKPKIPKMLASETKYTRRAVLRALNLYGEQPRVDVNGLTTAWSRCSATGYRRSTERIVYEQYSAAGGSSTFQRRGVNGRDRIRL